MDISMIGEFGLGSGGAAARRALQDAPLRKVCGDFESVFLHYILKSARHTLPENKLFGNSHESRLYKSMMDEKLAISMAQGKGSGLGQMLYEELTKGPLAVPGSMDLSEQGLDPIKNIDPPARTTGDSNENTVRHDSRLTV